MIDSGATVVVVAPGDCSVRKKLPTKVKLTTSNGVVAAREALILTPVGLRRGLLSEGCPRLLPASIFREFSPEALTVVTTADGIALPVVFSGDGVPMVSFLGRVSREGLRRRKRGDGEMHELNGNDAISGGSDDGGDDSTQSDKMEYCVECDVGGSDAEGGADSSTDSELEPRHLAFSIPGRKQAHAQGV